MTSQPLTTKQIETTSYSTIYGVYDASGIEVGKIEGEMITERVRFAGRTYGKDLKPRRAYQIIEVNGKTIRRYGHSNTLKAEVQELGLILK